MATTVNDRPGTRAHARMVRMSASKARVVLNLIRGKQVGEAQEILTFSERLASEVIQKCLQSAIANAEHNEDLLEEDLFVSACFADEGPTLKRFRPRARGRAGRIHKQTCHITIEVSRLTDDELDEIRTRSELKSEGRSARSKSSDGGDRARRVAKSRAAATDEVAEEEASEEEVATDEASEEAATEEAATEEKVTEVAEDSDEVAEDEVSEDEVSEEEVAEAKASEEDAPEDSAPEAGEEE